MDQKEVNRHFDKIAGKYDFYKKRNLFNYYGTLKNAVKKIVPAGSRVFDYGSGTGEVLSFLSTSFGVGYDPSREMVKISKSKFRKNKNLKFTSSLGQISGQFDYIIMIDVFEHLPNPRKEFVKIRRFMSNKTKLVVSFVDTSWEWLPKILEFLHLKMEEGPHRRVSYNKIIKTIEKAGYILVKPAPPLARFKVVVFAKKI